MNKSKFEIVYSLAVMLIIPSLLAFNTVYLATNVRRNSDKELQSRAELANSVLAISLEDSIASGDKAMIEDRLDKLNASQNELKNSAVVVKTFEGYEALASAEDNYEINGSDTLQYDIVYSRNWPVAKNLQAFTAEGNPTRVWNVASPVRDDNNEVIGIVVSDVFTTDVDEQVDATLFRSLAIMVVSAIAVLVLLLNHFKFIGYANLLRKQKELNQTMSDFLSVATHELKAPMTIIKGYISNVTDGDFGEIPEEAKKQLDVAVSQTDRLNELVQDLLNVSRIEQGRIQFNITNVNISEVIRTVVSTYKVPAEQKGLSIVYAPKQDYFVQADQGRVQEIITNLVDNAVKYSLQGEVVVSHSENAKMVVTHVRDTGIGMSAEERSRLFNRFYRAKNEKTKEISGTGLGLWIIKQYIEKMGGKITVDSLVGSGSEFQVSLKKSSSTVEAPKTDS